MPGCGIQPWAEGITSTSPSPVEATLNALLRNGVIITTNISWGDYLGQQLCMLASYFANNLGLDWPEVEKQCRCSKTFRAVVVENNTFIALLSWDIRPPWLFHSWTTPCISTRGLQTSSEHDNSIFLIAMASFVAMSHVNYSCFQ